MSKPSSHEPLAGLSLKIKKVMGRPEDWAAEVMSLAARLPAEIAGDVGLATRIEVDAVWFDVTTDRRDLDLATLARSLAAMLSGDSAARADQGPVPEATAVGKSRFGTGLDWLRVATEGSAVIAQDASARGLAEDSAATLVVDQAEVTRIAHGVRGAGDGPTAFVRDLALALDDWNRERGGRRPLRLAVEMPGPMGGRRFIWSPATRDLGDAGGLLRHLMHESFGGDATATAGDATGAKPLPAWLPRQAVSWYARRQTASATLSLLVEPFAAKARTGAGEAVSTAGGWIVEDCLAWRAADALHPVTAVVTIVAGVARVAVRMQGGIGGAHGAVRLLTLWRQRLAATEAEPTDREQDLARLVAEHRRRRQGLDPFRGLPIGKHVSDAPMAQPLLGPATESR